MATGNKGLLKGRWTLWIMALFFSLLAGFGALTILGDAADKTSYYVVAEDIPAGVQITSDMLLPIEVNVDGAPPKPLTRADFEYQPLYSKVPLIAGTVLQKSMVTDQQTLTSDLPEGFVLASILVAPENAVGGRITRGDLIDIAAVSDSDITQATAKVIMQKVQVIDVTVAPEQIAEAANRSGSDLLDESTGSKALYSGEPSLYLLAVSYQDFAKLALIKDANIYLALSASGSVDALDVYENGGTLFIPGEINPSNELPADGEVDPANMTEDQIKSDIERWYNQFLLNADVEMREADGSLEALIDDEVIDSIDLRGGSFDLISGIWTPASN